MERWWSRTSEHGAHAREARLQLVQAMGGESVQRRWRRCNCVEGRRGNTAKSKSKQRDGYRELVHPRRAQHCCSRPSQRAALLAIGKQKDRLVRRSSRPLRRRTFKCHWIEDTAHVAAGELEAACEGKDARSVKQEDREDPAAAPPTRVDHHMEDTLALVRPKRYYRRRRHPAHLAILEDGERASILISTVDEHFNGGRDRRPHERGAHRPIELGTRWTVGRAREIRKILS